MTIHDVDERGVARGYRVAGSGERECNLFVTLRLDEMLEGDYILHHRLT